MLLVLVRCFANKNTGYSNFFLSNEVEDQFESHLNLQQFCTVDRSLQGTAGMTRKINVYTATNGTEKVGVGEGNTKSISVSHEQKEYKILLAQNRFEYYDEEAMEDPMIVPVGMKHAGTDMFNTVNGDIFAEFKKATLKVDAATPDFAAFVDAQALLALENLEGVNIFGFVSPTDMAKVRKALKDDLKYVEAFAKNGYVGTVGGTHLYDKASYDAVKTLEDGNTDHHYQLRFGANGEYGAWTWQGSHFATPTGGSVGAAREGKVVCYPESEVTKATISTT